MAVKKGLTAVKFLVWVIALFAAGPVRAQEAGAGSPYLIPQTVFVGDRGRLVAPLGPAFAGVEPFVADKPEELPPAGGDLVIHRIELERRGGTSRLLIDFAAYAAGRLSLPPITLPPGAGGDRALQVTALTINIASILTPASRILAEPAPPLAVPGTTLLIYGALGLIALLIFLGAAAALGWRRYFAGLVEGFRRRVLLRSMERALKILRTGAQREQAAGAAGILARFSGEMRRFLSLYMRIDCQAWTEGEFSPLSPELSGIFRRSDTLRFSGAGIEPGELAGILDDAGVFLAVLRSSLSRGRETAGLSASSPVPEPAYPERGPRAEAAGGLA